VAEFAIKGLSIARHGAVDAKGVCYGQLDIASTETDASVASTIEEQLLAPPPQIVASPLARARGPAAVLAKRFGLQLRLDARVAELSMGQWEGCRFSDLEHGANREQFAFWMQNWKTAAPPGGETLLELQARVHACLSELTTGALVVGHAGVIRAVMVCRGASWDQAMQAKLAYGSVHTFGER
jgi:alpha-ribazole phosphatase